MPVLPSVRYVWRSLSRTPVFTVASVLTLAIGIGAAAAIFAVVNGILLRPMPYGHAEQLAGAWMSLPPLSIAKTQQTASTYYTFKRFAHTISGIALYQSGSANIADSRGTAEPERVRTAYMTANMIPLLQVSPALGRSFTDEEDLPSGRAVAIISDGLWRTRLGADPHVLGRTLDVNGVSREIVGVMPKAFRFPSAEAELWLPLALDPHNPYPDGFNYNAIVRLKPGVTIEQAQRDFTAVLPRVLEAWPMFASGVSTKMLLDQTQPRPVLTPMRDDVVGSIAGTLWIVAASTGLLLLVACANVANLILVRADGRQRELAVRTALGAGRSRVLAYFFAESAVLAVIAGALGLLVAAFGVRVLTITGPSELPRLAEVRIDGAVVLFTLTLSALVALGCSIIPAIHIGRTDLASTLREGGRGGTAGRARHRARGALVTAQIALALVMLAGSGLLMRSFQRLHEVRPGWNPDHLATLWLALPRARYPSDTGVVRFYTQLSERVGQLPGVRSVGLTSRLPLEEHGDNHSVVWVEGDASASSKIPPLQFFITTDGSFFKTMGIELLAGRTFERIDGRQRSMEAIVNRVTAEHFWHDSTGAAAIGKRFRTLPGGPWYTIVGVVDGVRDSSLQSPPAQTVYFPEVVSSDTDFSQLSREMGLVVRTAGSPTAIMRPVQRLIRELDPTLPTFDVRPMADVIRASLARLSFTMMIIGVAAVVTLLLGAIGLYGVIAYIVGLRTKEIGVHLALGASPRAVARMVTRQGVTLAGAGIVIGLVLFAILARFIRSLLFGVVPSDPVTLVVVSLVLIVIAVLASWIPARRAAHVDPSVALRME